MGFTNSSLRRLLLLLILYSSLVTFSLLLLPAHGSTAPPYSCDQSDPSTRSYGFCNQALPMSKRVDDLIARLTLQEKITQLGDRAPGIPRLGIPAYSWWSESLHGVSGSGQGIRFNGTIKGATSFPQVILTGATFDEHLWYRIGQAVGVEARAVYNAGQATGLTFWAPNINIFRDPRWGRGQETPGEDPTMTSKYAVAYVRGLQGEEFQGGAAGGGPPKILQASACCKHFTAYDMDNWKGITRYVFDAKVTAQDLADTYQPPFRSCVVDGHASGIMCSYNRVNGVPTCADPSLLTDTARGSWKFNGYITSDCDAVSIIHDAQGYAKTAEDAVEEVVKAGMDVNCGSYLQNHTGSAVEQGKLSSSDINRALHNLFSIRMRLGLFNGNPRNLPYGNIGPDKVCTPEHQKLALEAARGGIVLLKNTATLPLYKEKVSSVAVIGPNANSASLLLGNYAGPPCKSITPLSALQSYVKDVHYLAGCDTVACGSASIDQAVHLASSVDTVVLFMGLDLTQEKEELDRVSLVLPGMQQNLITSVAKAAKRPVILVMICGGPVDITFAKNDEKIGAILWAGYPGEAGGLAIKEIIFGEHNPGGRLPITWYPQDFTRVPMTDMRMRPDPASGYPGRTYRFYTGTPVFHFGYGLSYSPYSYSFVSVTGKPFHLSPNLQTGKASNVTSYDVSKIDSEKCWQAKLSAVVRVQNGGAMTGKHPVMLFVRKNNGKSGVIKELVAFQSVHLDAGEKTDVKFDVNPCQHLSRPAENGMKVLDAGYHHLMVGNEEHKVSVLV